MCQGADGLDQNSKNSLRATPTFVSTLYYVGGIDNRLGSIPCNCTNGVETHIGTTKGLQPKPESEVVNYIGECGEEDYAC